MRGGKKIARPENLHRLCGWRMGRVAYTKPPTHTSAGRKIDSRRVHRRGPLRWMFMRCGCFATFPSYFFASRRRRGMCRFVMNPTLNRSTKTRKVLSKQRTVSFFQSAKANKFVLIVEPLDYTTLVWRAPLLPAAAPTTIHACLLVFPIVLTAFAQKLFLLCFHYQTAEAHISNIFNLRAVEINLMTGNGGWGGGRGTY